MRILCHDAVVAAEQLGLNTDALKREQQALAEQENKVFVITDHMEHSEGIYREKGQSHSYPIVYAKKIVVNVDCHPVLAVLEETRRVVSLCDKKRDQHDDI